MKRIFFKLLSYLNKKILPSYRHRNLEELSKLEMLIIGYKYWVTKNYFDN